MINGLAGSLRRRASVECLTRILQESQSFDTILQSIYKYGGDKKITNTESLLLAALYGVKEMGENTKFLRLDNCSDRLVEEVLKSDGLIISTPVYFGDRSSLADSFIKAIKQRGGLPLTGKAVGSVSVGAKRNGGQETTNIYTLADCLDMGAVIVGNGPPTSQFGGTGWAGPIGGIIDDNFGFTTSKGTGNNVAMLSNVLNEKWEERKIKILFLVTKADKNGRFINIIKDLPFSSNVDLTVLYVSSSLDIQKCYACDTCPNGDLHDEYTCINTSDDMREIHSATVDADAIVLAYYSGADSEPDQFQRFIERTRFIRRNNFELSHRPFCFFCYTDCLMDIFPIRVMTMFLRHNMFLLGPFYKCFQNGSVMIENISKEVYTKRLEEFTYKTKQINISGINGDKTTYLPIGYENRKS